MIQGVLETPCIFTRISCWIKSCPLPYNTSQREDNFEFILSVLPIQASASRFCHKPLLPPSKSARTYPSLIIHAGVWLFFTFQIRLTYYLIILDYSWVDVLIIRPDNQTADKCHQRSTHSIRQRQNARVCPIGWTIQGMFFILRLKYLCLFL